MKIYVDGSGWNGRCSKYAIVRQDGETIKKEVPDLRTNNKMEYLALILALREAPQGAKIYSDSQLVVNQVNDEWKVKSQNLLKLCLEAQQLLEEKTAILKWIPREENKAGWLLEK